MSRRGRPRRTIATNSTSPIPDSELNNVLGDALDNVLQDQLNEDDYKPDNIDNDNDNENANEEFQDDLNDDDDFEEDGDIEEEYDEDVDKDQSDYKDEEGNQKQINKNNSSVPNKRKLLNRRQKNSNLNAVNRKRHQSSSIKSSTDPENLENDFNDSIIDENDNENENENDNTENKLRLVVNDEYVTPNDPKGDKKISDLGVLKGGRKFRVKVFKVPNRGDRLYAISTDVARLVGYRDSYFLFQKHTSLYRFKIDEDSKMYLINNDLLPATFKTRAAYLITARSAFKEFGARIIVDGKQVIDDYYEEKARNDGAIEGALINPILSNDGYTNSVNENQISVYERQKNIALLLSKNTILETETSWVYDHALKCRQFDSMLLYDRNELFKKRVQRDIYTNLNFVPNITQPNYCIVKKIADLPITNSKKKLQFDTLIGGFNVIHTGLKDIPAEIFEGTVSDEIKEAILQQQYQERSI
jgi:chromatin structure-remodeling complex protein RSC7